MRVALHEGQLPGFVKRSRSRNTKPHAKQQEGSTVSLLPCARAERAR